MNTIGMTLKRLRLEKGLSQNKLAKLSGIDQGYITRLEKSANGHRISLATLKSLAKGLDVAPEIFLQPEDCQDNGSYSAIEEILFELRKAIRELVTVIIKVATSPSRLKSLVDSLQTPR